MGLLCAKPYNLSEADAAWITNASITPEKNQLFRKLIASLEEVIAAGFGKLQSDEYLSTMRRRSRNSW